MRFEYHLIIYLLLCASYIVKRFITFKITIKIVIKKLNNDKIRLIYPINLSPNIDFYNMIKYNIIKIN